MEQGSCLNEDADISSFTEVDLSVPSQALCLLQCAPVSVALGLPR
jgi:hypothetical protein